MCGPAGVPLLINDRVDVALAAGPGVGVHVGQSDLPAAEARRLLGPGRLLGVSCKDEAEAAEAAAAGADYVGSGAGVWAVCEGGRLLGGGRGGAWVLWCEYGRG